MPLNIRLANLISDQGINKFHLIKPPRGPEYEILKDLSEMAASHNPDIQKEIAYRIDRLENIRKEAKTAIQQLREKQ